MSIHQAFRRQPVPQQYAQQLQTTVLPAPTRGLIQSENEAFMQAGGALVMDNWAPTMRGCKLRGGTIRWCDLHALDYPTWANNTAYAAAVGAYDSVTQDVYRCLVPHTSALTGTFAADRAAHPTYWDLAPIARQPIISGFEYVVGDNARRMYAAQATKLFDVTGNMPVLIKSGQTSGNYSTTQLSNQNDVHYLLAVNDNGDFPLRYDGTTWVTYNADQITGPAGTPVAHGAGLTYVWKYRNRLFFIQKGSMNAWYLGLNSIQGALTQIPLAGSATKGGTLLFGAVWSLDAGDGIDDKCVFVTTEGEVLIFTGSNPGDPNNWRQEGRYFLSRPMGMNAHIAVGGDLLIATIDGIIPVSAAIQKDLSQLELAMVTRTIKQLWRDNALTKQLYPWTLKKWDAYGAMFATVPGGKVGVDQYCLLVNNTTGAWARFPGYDAQCFLQLRDDFFFGTQLGRVMQCERSGYDDSVPYLATLVGGWELFGAPASEIVWHQARANFASSINEPFEPQLDSTTDYVIVIPPPPNPGLDPGLAEVWDEGLWDQMRWDQPAPNSRPAIRNTMWVSIGKTGFAHAPIVQVMVAQRATPKVELLAIAATFERAGVNV